MNHSDVVRGEEAHRLLESALFKEAVQEVEQDIVRRWRAETDLAKREELHADSRAVGRITAALKKIADAGRIAAHRLRDV